MKENEVIYKMLGVICFTEINLLKDIEGRIKKEEQLKYLLNKIDYYFTDMKDDIKALFNQKEKKNYKVIYRWLAKKKEEIPYPSWHENCVELLQAIDIYDAHQIIMGKPKKQWNNVDKLTIKSIHEVDKEIIFDEQITVNNT